MPGIWNKSGTQRFGLDGAPEVGARCYFFEASSTTPLTTYTDYSLAVENPAFVETDSYGAWPPVFFDDSANSFFRERATDAGGSVVYFDNAVVPIVGPGEGGDVPDNPVDPDAILKTGDIIVKYTTGTKSGFVRANGRTIGNATSGASERANADTQDLFEFLYNGDENLTVSGGRGSSATADYEAGKTIALPDIRGRALVGLDTMGNSAAGVFSALDTLGEKAGGSVTLVAANIPEITGTTSSDGAHTHTFPTVSANNVEDGGSEESARLPGGTSNTGSSGAHTHTVTAGSSSPTAVSTTAPSVGVTIYIKL